MFIFRKKAIKEIFQLKVSTQYDLASQNSVSYQTNSLSKMCSFSINVLIQQYRKKCSEQSFDKYIVDFISKRIGLFQLASQLFNFSARFVFGKVFQVPVYPQRQKRTLTYMNLLICIQLYVGGGAQQQVWVCETCLNL